MNKRNFPQLQVSWVDPATLHFPNRRLRRHSARKLKKLAQSINAFGFTLPLLIDENRMVLAGAARLTVALEGKFELVPVIRIEHLTEVQKRAYIIAESRLAEEATWDRELLRAELHDLVELGIDLDLTALDALEVDVLLSFDDEADGGEADDNVELLDEDSRPVSRLWDHWQVGDHSILCADSTLLANHERALAGRRAQLFITDPPFGNSIANNVSGLGRVKHDNFVAGSGEQTLPEFSRSLLRPAFRAMAANASPGAIAFIFSDWRALPHMMDAALGIFHEQKNLIVWSKTNAGMGTFYRSAHELILAYKVCPGAHINNFGLGEGGRHRTNVWTYPGANTFRKGRMHDLADHPTIKPRKLIADAIRDCSKRGGLVFDPFLGSGTTLVACAMTGRIGCGIELDPRYVDVALRRVSEFTGCEPLLDGRIPLSEVAAARKSEEG